MSSVVHLQLQRLPPLSLPQILYVSGLAVNAVGLVHGVAVLRQFGLLVCPASLALLLLSWRLRLGWASDAYAHCLIAGFALLTVGDLILAEPIADYLSFAGFAAYLLALFAFAAAVSMPSYAADDANEPWSIAYRGASPGAVPLRLTRGMPP